LKKNSIFQKVVAKKKGGKTSARQRSGATAKSNEAGVYRYEFSKKGKMWGTVLLCSAQAAAWAEGEKGTLPGAS